MPVIWDLTYLAMQALGRLLGTREISARESITACDCYPRVASEGAAC